MPRNKMINKGNARSMCWVCLACFCSVRAIIISWGSRPDTKAMLDDIRSKDKYRWHALARQWRARSSPEEGSAASRHATRPSCTPRKSWCKHAACAAQPTYFGGHAPASLLIKFRSRAAREPRSNRKKRPPLPSADLAGEHVPSVTQTCVEINKGYITSLNHHKRWRTSDAYCFIRLSCS